MSHDPGPIVRRVDNVIHWINRYTADKCYLVDSIIHLSNNWGQATTKAVGSNPIWSQAH